MAGEQIRKVYLDEDEDFSERQSYGRRVVTPVRYSTDPRDVGWVRQNIPCQTACPADTNVPAYIQMILENRYGRSYELNRIANVLPGTLGRICSRPVRGRLPPRLARQRRARQHLSSEARGRRPQAGRPPDHREPVHAVGQADRDRRRRLRRHRRGPRSVDARPRRHDLRGGEDPGRHAVLRHPRVPPAARRALGRGQERAAPRRRAQGGRRGRQRPRTTSGCPACSRTTTRCCWRPAAWRRSGCRCAASTTPRRIPVRRLPNAEYGLDFLMELHRGETEDRRQAGRGGRRRLHRARLRARVAAARRRGRHDPHAHDRGVHPGHQGGDPRGQARGHQDPRPAHAGRADHRRRAAGSPASSSCRTGSAAGARAAGGRRSRSKARSSSNPATRSWSRSARRPSTTTSTSPVELDRWGAVKVDEHGMTSVEGLFAAGDFVIGASTVVEAVGLGRKTALEMDTWLMGRERRKLVVKIETVEEPRRDRAWDFIPPQHMPMEPMKSRFDTLDARGREGLRPGPRGRGGQALLSLPPQVRDRPRQLHLLPRLHRGRAAQLHQAGQRHRHQGRRQLRRAAGDHRVGPGRRDLDRQQRVHPLRRLLHGLPDQMHLDHQERDLLSGRLRRSRPSGRWRQTSTT